MTDDRYSALRSLESGNASRFRVGNEPSILTYPATVGIVFANPLVPTSTNKFFAVHPVNVVGAEGEGNAGTSSVDLTRTFYVYVIGSNAPVAGDMLVCRYVGNRWVAERMGTASSRITLPGCPCLIPLSLTMSVVRPDANFGMFQNCTLAWQATPPGLALLSLGASSYLSTTTILDELTLDEFRYHFFCSGGYFCINRVYETSVYGSPFSDAIRYRWQGGQPGNSCTPFLMSNGRVFPGGDPTSVVTLTE